MLPRPYMGREHPQPPTHHVPAWSLIYLIYNLSLGSLRPQPPQSLTQPSPMSRPQPIPLGSGACCKPKAPSHWGGRLSSVSQPTVICLPLLSSRLLLSFHHSSFWWSHRCDLIRWGSPRSFSPFASTKPSQLGCPGSALLPSYCASAPCINIRHF